MTQPPLTNYEAWRLYTRDLISPDSFIDMGFFYMIAASLQRRVYLGSDERPTFPNLYIIFVGPPAVGKGLVIVEMSQILRYHKLRNALKINNNQPEQDFEATQAMLMELKQQNPSMPIEVPQATEQPLAIPIAGDCTTFEALIRSHAKSIRTASYPGVQSVLLKNGMYSHSSLCFCLEEISSLFRKHSEDVCRYLIKAFDCQNYAYETKTPGLSDRILSPCLNFIGGTQSSFIQEVFKDRVLTEGFASRTIFLSEDTPRFHRYDMFTLNAEQKAAKAQLIAHVDKLLKLFGRVQQTPEAYEFIKHYVEKVLSDPSKRPNKSPKLDSYYGRKRVHVEKLAMAIHFSESTEMTIPILPYQRAIEILDKLELKMDAALNVGGRNQMAGCAGRIVKFLHSQGPKTLTEIWVEFVSDLNEQELVEMMKFLCSSGRVNVLGEGDRVKYMVAKIQL